MMQANYPTKKELKAAVGKPFNYTETSWFGPEYVATGFMLVCNQKRSWYAKVITKHGVIVEVK